MIKATAALSLLVLGVTPVLGNGTISTSPIRHHHKPAPYPLPVTHCPMEPPCLTDVPPCYMLHSRTGFYAGGQFGYNNMRGSFVNTLTINGISSADTGFKKNNNVIGELFVGARYLFGEDILLGLEVAADLDNNTLKKTLNPNGALVKAKIERDYAIVPAITLGRIFQTRYQFFAKLGMGISRFTTKVSHLGLQTSFSKHKTRIGVVPSLGLEYSFSRYLSAIGTLTYEFYDQVTVRGNNLAGPNTADINKVKHVQYVAAKVGLLVKI
jgi:hypothetical protein